MDTLRDEQTPEYSGTALQPISGMAVLNGVSHRDKRGWP